MDDTLIKQGEVWGIPFEFDSSKLVDLRITRILNDLARINEPGHRDELGVLRYFDLFYSCFGEEQWANIEESLYAIGKGTFPDAAEFFFEAMQAAAADEGVELKN